MEIARPILGREKRTQRPEEAIPPLRPCCGEPYCPLGGNLSGPQNNLGVLGQNLIPCKSAVCHILFWSLLVLGKVFFFPPNNGFHIYTKLLVQKQNNRKIISLKKNKQTNKHVCFSVAMTFTKYRIGVHDICAAKMRVPSHVQSVIGPAGVFSHVSPWSCT